MKEERYKEVYVKKLVFFDWSEVTAGYGLMAPGVWSKDASPYWYQIEPHCEYPRMGSRNDIECI